MLVFRPGRAGGLVRALVVGGSAGQAAAADRGDACAGTTSDVGWDGVFGGECGGGVGGDGGAGEVAELIRRAAGQRRPHTRVASLRATAQVAWM